MNGWEKHRHRKLEYYPRAMCEYRDIPFADLDFAARSWCVLYVPLNKIVS